MLEYFKDLSEKEINLFGKFVRSPYFNSSKSIIKLFNYLREAYPEISEDYISKKNLSINIYSEENVNDPKIRKLISNFLILMEKLLTQIEADKDVIGKKIAFLNSMHNRKFDKKIGMNLKELYNIQDKTFSKDDIYYNNRINLEDLYYRYNEDKYKTEFVENLQSKSDHIDYYFMFLKLHCFRDMNIYKTVKKKEFVMTFRDEVISNIEKNKKSISSNHPNLYIIYLVTMMESEMGDIYQNILLDYLKKNSAKFENEKLQYYYNYVRTNYIRKINLGMSEYRKDAFDLLKILEKKNLILSEKTISDSDYNSAVNIALSLKEYEWVEQFIENYRQYMAPEVLDDAYNLAKAKLFYHRKKYQNIFTYLNMIKFKIPYYYMHSKFLLGRVYFEMNNIESSKYIIDNLKQYLRVKNTLSPVEASVIKLFNKYLYELIKISETTPSQRSMSKFILKKTLDNEKFVVPDKKWFYEKLSKM